MDAGRDTQLYSATEGKLVKLNVDAYLDLVANRPSPEDKGDLRQDEIISVSIGSPTTAHVRVKNVYMPKKFVDDLTLVQINGKWQIVSKVWHFDLQPG
ncbi:nuclear transport factor 2 family protein [Ensifer canadensis]|uniref:nuclear transport factor 2 family protein n=1 Tax=Ensifer canadensis TaxID=555315 RepID=UPI0035E3D71D